MEKNLDQLKKIISEKFGVAGELIVKEAELTADLNLDHLEISDLISIIVSKFQLNITEDDLKSIKTVQDLLILIETFSEEL